jgi:hypothetical protein
MASRESDTPPSGYPRPAASRIDRRQARRTIRRRRLLPLLGALVVVVAAVGWLVSGSGGGTPRPSAAGHPSVASTSSSTTTTTAPPPYEPAPVTPQVTPAQPGEGQWVPVDTWDPGPPSILTTTFRPDPTQPSIEAYATWIRTSSTLVALYLGYKGPGPTTLARGQEMVPPAAYPTLLATFNSGFYEADAAAGFFTNGTLYYPMVNGLATVVTYADGHTDIVDWEGGSSPTPDILMARQNLSLLVDAGVVVPGAAVGSAWGSTLGGVPAVWRTGLGIDAQGNLMYVAAPAQTAASLGQILVDLGAIRGMQLDINPAWPIFVTYGAPGAASPSLFVPNPNQVPTRFLTPSTKDFFAVFARQPGQTAQPW